MTEVMKPESEKAESTPADVEPETGRLDAAEIFHDNDFEEQLRTSGDISDVEDLATKPAKLRAEMKRPMIEIDRYTDYVVDHPGGVCSQQ
eukprot:5260903-Karenia_brevis.AAC.1